MPDVVIDNPVINSPFREPERHFVFGDQGITNEIEEGRRRSSYFIPIAHSRRQGAQLQFDTEWTRDRIAENQTVNEIRERVSQWRKGGYAGVTPTTARLLKYWTDPGRDKPLFFCQIEALETAIYITEVAKKYGDAWIENRLREGNDTANPGMPRIAFKMATGSGKTVVMGMLIAWQALNKQNNQQDPRFTDAFLVVTPGITIKDRLRVLLPNDPGNYYRERDVLPPDLLERLAQGKIIVTNFHTFLQRERGDAASLTKKLLGSDETKAFTETPDQMVRRVCRELGNKKQIVIINDEAHHCYRRKPEAEEEKLSAEERSEAKKRDEEARIWLTGIEAVQRKIGLKAIYDLSATPFFLRGSGWPEGTLFPWVVSDFSLIDAIESGIVKVPRVPVDDNQMSGTLPTYRALWEKIRDELPRKGRGTEAVEGEPVLPKELEGALHALYGNYERYHREWEADTEARAGGRTPPVFIVVCNNTNVSKLVFDYIAGWEKLGADGAPVLVAGKLSLFRNVVDGRWSARPTTILVDSEQLESGEALSADFKRIAAAEIEEFKAEYRQRFPGRDPDELTDEDLLREVMNTVGKVGRLGEQVKCVVSVSMLTEGWDANTVTHILGVRAFGTQLLCEQVVGRGLRRTSYAVGEDGHLTAEYAEVYGVPFSFIPCSGSTSAPPRLVPTTRVHALEERAALEIRFPRLTGYRYDLGEERIEARFGEESRLVLSTEEIPTRVEVAGIIGPRDFHDLDELKKKRGREVIFLLAKLVLERFFRDDERNLKPWLFPQLLRITTQWYNEWVVCKDNTFKQLLYFQQFALEGADRIYRGIAAAEVGTHRLMPILHPYDAWASTVFVDFDTTRPVYETRADRCHVSHIVADTKSWEQKLAQTLEEMPEVVCYVKNDRQPGFAIPYAFEGSQHQYFPDFVARVDDGHGRGDLLNLLVEVIGEKKKEKEAKVATARSLWVPAVNNHAGLGRWASVEVNDPFDCQAQLRAAIQAAASRSRALIAS